MTTKYTDDHRPGLVVDQYKNQITHYKDNREENREKNGESHGPCKSDVKRTANQLENPVEDMERMRSMNEQVTSVDTPIGISSERTLVGTIPDQQESDPAERLQGSDLIDNINRWLGELPDKQCEALLRIGSAFRILLGRDMQPTDRLFADEEQTSLPAHLPGNYSVDHWQPPTKASSLDPKRLKRVLDFIDNRLATEISLDDLAAEACLSPFHFSRLFRDATGLTPCRYVTFRRVQAARDKLTLSHSSLIEIALNTGFRSQANFIRVFRKATGLTPGQYRELHRR